MTTLTDRMAEALRRLSDLDMEKARSIILGQDKKPLREMSPERMLEWSNEWVATVGDARSILKEYDEEKHRRIDPLKNGKREPNRNDLEKKLKELEDRIERELKTYHAPKDKT